MSPRRSARLAAKAAKATKVVQEVPEVPTFADSPHICYDCDSNYDECMAIMRQYLKDIEYVRGRLRKSVIIICMIRFLMEQSAFLTKHPRFQHTVYRKMKEFQQEIIPDAELHHEFQLHVANMLKLLDQA